MIGQTRYEEMFNLILKYIVEFEKHIDMLKEGGLFVRRLPGRAHAQTQMHRAPETDL